MNVFDPGPGLLVGLSDSHTSLLMSDISETTLLIVLNTYCLAELMHVLLWLN